MVGFVQTTYTVLENAGSVEVCVQLTRPLTDILDETVRVSVVDYSSSVYIPAGAALASKTAVLYTHLIEVYYTMGLVILLN